jgi:hypothetical protein
VLALILLLASPVSTRPVPTPPSASFKALGACSAVTAADLERALGRTFGRGQEENHGAASTCDYGSGRGQVSITIQRLAAKPDIPSEIASLKRSIPESTVRMSPGLGSAAFFLDIAGAGTQLHVIRGDRDYVMVSILGFGDADQVSLAAVQLARGVLARL